MNTYKDIADENEKIVATGWYVAPSGATVRIGDAVAAACAGTASYSSEDLDRLSDDAAPGTAAIEVTGESSMSAALRLNDEGAQAVAVLNFASARNAGCGYLRGTRAQEEGLCRVSALYITLCQTPDDYAAHRASKAPAYSHRVIYSRRSSY